MSPRSSQPGVRNPLVLLPAAQKVRDLPPEARAALRSLLRELSADCRARATRAWVTHKAPMAAYWKAQAVYTRHASTLIPPP